MNTSEAPKEVWTGACGKALVTDGMKRWEDDVKYIREVHAQAMVAAAYADAVEIAATRHEHWSETRGDADGAFPVECDVSACANIAFGIRARTTPDEQAALDALLKAERVRLLREIEVHHALALTGDVDGRECHAFVTDLIEKETGQ